ncbi:hypothetical protein TNCV_1914583 [Trichonephila clavipes]|nr:hypothetical protein TNCV_1914583 [Trichonephila clavipes]
MAGRNLCMVKELNLTIQETAEQVEISAGSLHAILCDNMQSGCKICSQASVNGTEKLHLAVTDDLLSSINTFLVPKPYSSTKQAPVNNTEISRLWRTHFPDAEEKLIHDIGCVKPVIKLLKELTINELIEIHETKQDVEELEALDPVQTEDRMTVGSLTEGLLFIEKELQNLEIIDSNEEIIYFSKTRNEEIISMLQR